MTDYPLTSAEATAIADYTEEILPHMTQRDAQEWHRNMACDGAEGELFL